MKTFIIIPTYNERDNIEKLLNKIFKINNDVEIYIIDDSINNEILQITNKFKQVCNSI